MSTIVFDQLGGGLLDQATANFFQNEATLQSLKCDSISLPQLQHLCDNGGFLYSYTITLDFKKKDIRNLINNVPAQWRYIKRKIVSVLDRYKFRSILVPELTKSGNVHCHGVILFKDNDYDDMSYRRSVLNRYIARNMGNALQWTRINSMVESYTPTETNVKIRKPQKLSTWHKYLMKSGLRKRLGIQDLVNF